MMAGPDRRADFKKEIPSKLTPLPPSAICSVDDEAAALAEALLSTAARLARPVRRKQGSKGKIGVAYAMAAEGTREDVTTC